MFQWLKSCNKYGKYTVNVLSAGKEVKYNTINHNKFKNGLFNVADVSFRKFTKDLK